MPPPYSLTQTGNAPPSTVALGDDAPNNSQGTMVV